MDEHKSERFTKLIEAVSDGLMSFLLLKLELRAEGKEVPGGDDIWDNLSDAFDDICAAKLAMEKGKA